ncbi:transposase [Rhizobium skierniewicense]|uniref:Transposase n=1 Tax=Rhizobium skierniewicense TaxID=984260 RepID=A0A7W6CFX3_9HYPH|nr:winged helix-turn-helix domain-containing protein [Rhizobium skierniewicense]MBB3948659.1 transposase [Rhizobium skierniewicense]
MGTALDIRRDYTAEGLRQLARKSRDADLSRRLLALSVIYEGGSRRQAASMGGVGLQIVRDWVERFNQSGPDGLKTRKAKGREPLLSDKQRKSLIEVVEKGPVPYLDGVVRWRLVDLMQWLWQEHRISVSRQTRGRELQALGYRKLTARPRHHAQDPQAIVDFKKASPPQWQTLPPEQPEENE